MVNEEKVKLMANLAMYEKKEGKKYLPVSKFYRRDYIGLALIRNFFQVTIGYALLLLAVGVYSAEYFLNNIHKMDLVGLGTQVGIAYLIVLGVFTVFTYIEYAVKYYLAKKSVRKYYAMLTQLNKMYGRQERKNYSANRRG